MLSGFEVDNNRGQKIVMFTKTFMGQAGIQNYLLVERGGGVEGINVIARGRGGGGGNVSNFTREFDKFEYSRRVPF